MSNVYDIWERLVKVVLRRERDLELALAHSPSSSSLSSIFISELDTPCRDDQNSQLELLLLSDHKDIRSLDPVARAIMKDIYLSLGDNPTLFDGKMSFHIDKKTGKKCAMIGARKLTILCGEIPAFWILTSHKWSRFSKVAELKRVLSFDIRGKIDKNLLSPSTHYAAYLVFQFTKIYKGSPATVYGTISYDNSDNCDDTEDYEDILHLEPGQKKNGNVAEKRTTLHFRPQRNGDWNVIRPGGWTEVEIGKFYNGQEDSGLLEARVWNYDTHLKSGLVVEGIEFRPTDAEVFSVPHVGETIDVPQYFLCPISHQIMKDPVTTVTGITYERENIQHWMLTADNAICLATDQPLPRDSDLTPNHMLRRLIQAWCVTNAKNGIDQIPTRKTPLHNSLFLNLI